MARWGCTRCNWRRRRKGAHGPNSSDLTAGPKWPDRLLRPAREEAFVLEFRVLTKTPRQGIRERAVTSATLGTEAPSHGQLAIAILRGLGLAFRFAPLSALVLAIAAPAGALALPVVAALTGEVISHVPAVLAGEPGAVRDVTRLSLLIAAAFVVMNVAEPIEAIARQRVTDLLRRGLATQVMTGVLSLPGLHHFEDPESRDRLLISSWAYNGPSQLVFLPTLMVQAAVGLAGYFAVAAAAKGWWVPALVMAAGIPGALLTGRYMAAESTAQSKGSVEARWARYHTGLLTDLPAAKEVRIFGLTHWLLARRQRHWLATIESVWTARRHGILVGAFTGALSLGITAAAYVWLAADAAAGRLALGEFVAAGLAIVGIRDHTGALLQNYGFVRRDIAFLPTALRMRRVHEDDPRMAVATSPAAPADHHSGIVFENVSFAYPGTTRPVLRDINLAIPAGQTLALVGVNGAGKTTLIKLLCRLYDPTDGRILVDGIDLRDLGLDKWRRRLAVAFQDFVRYPLSAVDNVAFGAPDAPSPRDLAVRAADAVGVRAKLEGLPAGWDTLLRRDLGGVDLSGGEWQRVALARMMAARYGRGADVLVLDEPTANLDVRVENDLYHRFADLTEAATTILVSHRFSTVRMAERAVVLDGGVITEDGSHAELVRARGTYAAMYEAQARAFGRSAAAGDDEDEAT